MKLCISVLLPFYVGIHACIYDACVFGFILEYASIEYSCHLNSAPLNFIGQEGKVHLPHFKYAQL